jgi:hypothetical protein
LLGLLLIPTTIRTVRAQVPKTRTAFAVVIGNNRSLNGRRPDLHYADDDAAKYFDILQTIAPGRVFLLANFDSDTERLFPQSREQAVAPTRGALQRIGQQVTSGVRAAAERGSETDLYFVFADERDPTQREPALYRGEVNMFRIAIIFLGLSFFPACSTTRTAGRCSGSGNPSCLSRRICSEDKGDGCLKCTCENAEEQRQAEEQRLADKQWRQKKPKGSSY